MNIFPPYRKSLILLFGCFFVIILLTSVYVQTTQAQYLSALKSKIEEQKTTLSSIEGLLSTENVDAVTKSIVSDCNAKNRDRFDTLLSKLSELKNPELAELEILFDACGNYYAEIKAVMVMRLQKEFMIYSDLVSLLTVADGKDNLTVYNVEKWSAIIALEYKKSELTTNLVDIQDRIIQGLLRNLSISSDEMQTMMVEGQETKEVLSRTTDQINTIKQSL